MQYRCRVVKPSESPWESIEATSPEEAANSFHEAGVPTGLPSISITTEDGPSRTKVFFALVEIEGHGELVSRVYYAPIWRKGGIRPACQTTIADVAKALGWTRDPSELLEEGWDCEESWDEASAWKEPSNAP